MLSGRSHSCSFWTFRASEFNFFRCRIEVTKLRRQIEPLFDKKILNRILQGMLTFDNKRLEVIGGEWVSEQNIEGHR